MNLQFYLEKLQSSEVYKNFKSENSDAYFCSGFFIIDESGNDKENKKHLDYYVPSIKKIFSFQLEEEVKIFPVDVPVEVLESNVPHKISEKCNFDFKEIEKLIFLKVEKENIKNKIQKIILSLQSKNEKSFLLGTVFVSGLGMIKINIDLEKKEIIDFEKKSFFDMLRKDKPEDND